MSAKGQKLTSTAFALNVRSTCVSASSLSLSENPLWAISGNTHQNCSFKSHEYADTAAIGRAPLKFFRHSAQL